MSVHIEHSSSQVVTVDGDGLVSEGVLEKIVKSVISQLEDWRRQEEERWQDTRLRPRENAEPTPWRATLRVEFTVDDAY